MLKSLRRKFIAITMVSVVFVLALIIGIIDFSNYKSVCDDAENRMDMLIAMEVGLGPDTPEKPTGDNNGQDISGQNEAGSDTASKDTSQNNSQSLGDFPNDEELWDMFSDSGMSRESMFDMRYFLVTVDSDGNVVDVDVENIVSVTASDAEEMTEALLKDEETEGFIDSLRFEAIQIDGSHLIQLLKTKSSESSTGESMGSDVSDDESTEDETTEDVTGSEGVAISSEENYTMYLYLDCAREFSTLKTFVSASMLVSLLGVALVFVLVLVLSKIVLRPVAESYRKQKRFITDASHEIKTPLAIIGANAEVLEMEVGESEWINSINRQIKRLSSLTEKLVFLSRMDEEGEQHVALTEFSLTDALMETAESFDAVAAARNKNYTYEIAPAMSYYGDEGMIRQMISLLLDNAMKYSSDGGEIRLKATPGAKSRSRKYTIVVYNTVEEISIGNQDILFERFYRKDESRNSKTGGHGIGLSVVWAIVEAHKGKISAESTDGKSLTFTIQI